jgi:hypothetical protein
MLDAYASQNVGAGHRLPLIRNPHTDYVVEISASLALAAPPTRRLRLSPLQVITQRALLHPQIDCDPADAPTLRQQDLSAHNLLLPKLHHRSPRQNQSSAGASVSHSGAGNFVSPKSPHPEQRAEDGGAIIAGQADDAGFDDEATL